MYDCDTIMKDGHVTWALIVQEKDDGGRNVVKSRVPAEFTCVVLNGIRTARSVHDVCIATPLNTPPRCLVGWCSDVVVVVVGGVHTPARV